MSLSPQQKAAHELQTRLHNLRTIMERNDMPLKEAMEFLGLPETAEEQYAILLDMDETMEDPQSPT